MIAYKFLARGAVSPFTGFRWPEPGEWVEAQAGRDEWIHACRRGDLPYWLDDELWRVELQAPVHEARYQVAAPRARLVARIEGWDPPFEREYAWACLMRTRDLASPHLDPKLRGVLEGRVQPQGIADALGSAGAIPLAAWYVSDAASYALQLRTATVSYIACLLASTLDGGLAAFEAERAWQAGWLAGRLGLGDG